MRSEHEIEERRYHVSNALASQRLEGIEPDLQTVEDLTLFSSGNLEIVDVLARLRARTERVNLRNRRSIY